MTLDEAEIKQRAHQIWERENRPEGREIQNYFDAVAELMAERDGGQRPTSGPTGISSNLHPGGVAPTGGPATVGSIGTASFE